MQQGSEALAGNSAPSAPPALGFPLVLLERRASEGIPTGTAGVLLGARQDRSILIEEAKAFPSDQGALFRQAVRKTVLELMGRPGGLSVVGFFRCQTDEGADVTAEDEALCERYFPDSEAAFLLVKPWQESAALFLWRNGRLQPATEPAPVRDSRDTAEIGAARRRWIGAVTALGAAALGVAALLLVVGAQPAASPPPPPVPLPPPQSTPQPAPALAQSAGHEPPADDPGVRDLIERWAAAWQAGRLDAVLPYYAPRLESYFTTPNAARVDVRDRALLLLGRYGRPKTFRVSDVRVVPVGRSRAMATFHVHWNRIAGNRTYSGDASERMQLVRAGSAWQIVSEDSSAGTGD